MRQGSITLANAAGNTGKPTDGSFVMCALERYENAVIIDVRGTYVGTLIVQQRVDDTNRTTILASSIVNVNTGAAGDIGSAGTGIFVVPVVGATSIYVVASAWTSGTAVVNIRPALGAFRSLAGGEAHVGEFDASTKTVKVAPAVQAAAYSIGHTIGGKLTLANAQRVAGKGVVLQNILILDRSNTKPTGDLLFFDADPTAATITDRAPFVASTDDLKIVARIPVGSGDWKTINSKAYCTLPNLGREIETVGTTLYAAFVIDAAVTLLTVADFQFTFGFLR